MNKIKFSVALKQLHAQQDTEVIATERARATFFKAGRSRETDQTTRRLKAILSERLSARIIAG